MRKRIKKFLYSLLVAFLSIGISFNTEARLPKYMAQRAAELLIEKSGLQLKSTTLINDDYLKLKENVILFSIASALQKYTEEGNIQNFLTSIIKNMNQAKCEHKTEIERFTKAISDKNIQLHLIVAIQALDKANEQFTEQVALALKDAIIANEQAIYAHKLVEFLYTTKKRQHLANWMKRRLPFKVHGTAVAWEEDENDFKSLLDDIDGAFNDTEVFRTFVNQCFPCWTGTLTCFMLSGNSVANKALSDGKIVEKCTESLNSHESAYKVIGILFTLELVDSWNDVKSITGSTEGAPTRTAQYDPYDCVPVPNTAYIRLQTPSKAYYQGSCMISTIRNLMYILCRATSDSTEIVKGNMKEGIEIAFSASIDTVPGTTSALTLKGFAEKILPGVTDQYQPTLELFVCTLNSLLRVDMQESIAIPRPHQYISGSLGIHQGVIESILRKITNHNGHLTVTLNNNPTKLSNDWPQSCLIINDLTVNKKITIAFGLRGTGHHVEIIDITHADH